MSKCTKCESKVKNPGVSGSFCLGCHSAEYDLDQGQRSTAERVAMVCGLVAFIAVPVSLKLMGMY